MPSHSADSPSMRNLYTLEPKCRMFCRKCRWWHSSTAGRGCSCWDTRATRAACSINSRTAFPAPSPEDTFCLPRVRPLACSEGFPREELLTVASALASLHAVRALALHPVAALLWSKSCFALPVHTKNHAFCMIRPGNMAWFFVIGIRS